MRTRIQEDLIQQYDGSNGALFYRLVMGDQSNHIHFGIFQNGDEDIREASENTVAYLSERAATQIALDEQTRMIDLGSGAGGPAHYFAKRFGSTVSCVNLCPEQNRKNLEAAKQLALDRYIELYEMDFTELDKSWNGTFDLAYSIDAFCHCLDKRTALQEARRVLSPEGVFVLTDILIGDGYERSKLDSFAKHNVGRLASLDEYSADFDAAGWNQTSCHDLSQHLGPFFRKMREKLESEQEQLLSIGMGAQYIEAYARSLKERERLMEEGAFSWKCFVLQK